MTPSTLWNAKIGEIHDRGRDLVPGGLQGLDGDANGTAGIPTNGGDVLDDDAPRLQDLCRPCHPHVQLVAGIRPARVVVEVRVTLAGRTSEQDVDRPDAVPKLCFGPPWRPPERAGEQRRDVLLPDLGRWEVQRVDGGGITVQLDSSLDPDTPTDPSGSLCEAEGQSAAASEEVHDADPRDCSIRSPARVAVRRNLASAVQTGQPSTPRSYGAAGGGVVE